MINRTVPFLNSRSLVMKRIIIVLLILFMAAGCKTTGYQVKVDVKSPISHDTVSKAESSVVGSGYWMKEREKVVYGVNNPNRVSTLFEKKRSKKDHDDILVMFIYTKDTQTNTVQDFSALIYNHFLGDVVPDIKSEIDDLGNVLYKEFSSTFGTAMVTIDRKQWGPPF